MFFCICQCNYQKAVDYFSKSYDACKMLGNKEAMETARVHFGIAQTHHKLTLFNEKINENTDKGMKDLIEWKGRRKFSRHSDTASDDTAADEVKQQVTQPIEQQADHTEQQLITENTDSTDSKES